MALLFPFTLVGALYLLCCWAAPPLTQRFREYQQRHMEARLPRLPLQLEVYGSIFQTAYYFVDVSMGAPKPQSLSMIIDTGSSTQGIPCQDCEACGNSHWDAYYNRTKSEYNERMPCGNCTTCRLNTSEDSLRSLVPPLSDLAGNHELFTNETAKILLNDSSKMQCLYHVHYAEGSSLSGLFFKDVVWMNILHNQSPIANHPESMECPAQPLSAGPSLPLLVPVGCHIEETHLFFDQKASGILGLEFWGTKGVPTFPTAVLDSLEELYLGENHTVVSCQSDTDVMEEDISTPFHYGFSLCLSPKGGLMSFGGANSEYHLPDHVVHMDTPAAKKFQIPIITTADKSDSYLVGLTGVRIAKNETLAPNITSTDLYNSIDDDIWDEIEIKPVAVIHDEQSNSDVNIIPTLLDSGTTLTYLPARLFKEMLEMIGHRVAINSAKRDADKPDSRRMLHRVTPEELFASENNGLILLDSFRPASQEPPRNMIEYIPLTNRPLLAGPKRLIRLSTLDNFSILRSLRGKIASAFSSKMPSSSKRRRLQDSPPGWYAVIEPTVGDTLTAEDSLVGFLDIPSSMEGAAPRALVSKLDGYNNGECWWLQGHEEDLPLFPHLAFDFFGNVSTVWHPLSYLYSGTNHHFWCLAIMTDGSSDEKASDEEIIFGSNSFVHHDIVFSVENRAQPAVKPEGTATRRKTDKAVYGTHENSFVTVIPAVCPEKSLEGRS